MEFSEYVSPGHPDKVADFISEYILDRIIDQDRDSRYALEVQIKDNHVSLAGEITTNAKLNFKKWVKSAIEKIGYTKEYAAIWGFENTINPQAITVSAYVSKQSNDISQGVSNDGWGDQGIMFGMAVNSKETKYMPLDYYYAKEICMKLYNSRIAGLDIKTQVVCDSGIVRKIIVAIPMIEDKTNEVENIVRSVVDGSYKLIINGTGRYVKHASIGDCGTTGRKLAVDFYGGNCNVGGGSPWTKDGTKADLTLNIYARKLAVDYIKENGAEYVKCGIECCIGKNEVTIVYWDKNNKEIKSETRIVRPKELIDMFGLKKPIYASLCFEGLFSIIDN